MGGGWEGGLGSRIDALEKRAHLRRLSGGSGCGNDTVVVSRLHRCIAELQLPLLQPFVDSLQLIFLTAYK